MSTTLSAFGTRLAAGSVRLAAAGPYPATAPPGAVNRALKFVADTTGLATPGLLMTTGLATAITSQNWAIDLHARIDGPALPSGSYFYARAENSIDEYSLYYTNNVMRFFANGSTPQNVSFPLTVSTPPGPDFLTIRFTYDGSIIRAFLNDAPAGTYPITGLVLHAGEGNPLAIGLRNNTGGGGANITVDYFKLTDAGVVKVDFQFNEPSPGPYLNMGTAYGQLGVGTPPPESVTL